MYKYSIYKSLLTNKKTMFIASQGTFSDGSYIEYQIEIVGKKWAVFSTDGYKPAKLIAMYPKNYNLKTIINNLGK